MPTWSVVVDEGNEGNKVSNVIEVPGIGEGDGVDGANEIGDVGKVC